MQNQWMLAQWPWLMHAAGVLRSLYAIALLHRKSEHRNFRGRYAVTLSEVEIRRLRRM